MAKNIVPEVGSYTAQTGSALGKSATNQIQMSKNAKLIKILYFHIIFYTHNYFIN